MLESPARIRPSVFEEQILATLANLTIEIQRAAESLGKGLHPASAGPRPPRPAWSPIFQHRRPDLSRDTPVGKTGVKSAFAVPRRADDDRIRSRS